MASEPTDELMASFNAAWDELTKPGAPFEMAETEVNGIPTRIYTSVPPDMRAIWELTAGYGDTTYLVYGDERYSYADIHARVATFAHWLRNEHGIGAGDRVAVSMRNYPEWVITYWATISIGAAVVAMNAWWVAPEMVFALQDSKPKVLVVDDERLEPTAAALADIDAPPAVVAVRTANNDDNDDSDNNDDNIPQATLWTDILPYDVSPDTAPNTLPDANIAPDDDACIFYTSGTTGFPKGAQITHRNTVHNLFNLGFVNACGDLARSQRQTASTAAPSDRQLAALAPVPLFHATGCNCILHPVSIVGGKLVLMHHWDPAEALRLIETETITNFTGVPTMSRELLAHPNWATTDTSSIISMGGGGAALQPDLVHRIDQGLRNGRPGTGYGLTETSGVATMATNEYYVARPGSVGPVMPCMDAKLVDPETKVELASDATGELALRGPNVLKGYLNHSDALSDGWFYTGDIARMDDDGWLYIVDRAKDVVIRGGENVHCGEVEIAIYELNAVAEAAVFGVPDERLGEEVAVALYLNADSELSETQLLDHLTGRLAQFKHPSHVWFTDEPLPRNANGKFLKSTLRTQFLERTVGLYQG